MRRLLAALLGAGTLAVGGAAAEPAACPVPDSLLLSDSQLKRAHDVVAMQHRLLIAVVGTGSSALAGPEGPGSAYPARLESALIRRLPGIAIRVVTVVRPRLTGLDLAKGMDKLLVDE